MGRKKHEDNPRVESDISPGEVANESGFLNALRPQSFDEYVGQKDIVSNLKVSVAAAKKGGWVLDHFLFAGPPGLGKTTLAHVIANEMDAKVHVTSGPAIDHKGVLASLLTDLREGDVLFIDEIHRLSPVIEEVIYPAIEDFRFDFFVGEGPHAKSVNLKLPRFTLLGATTRMGSLSSPLLDRFGFHWQLRYYDVDELCVIVERSAGLLGLEIDTPGAREIACRSRGTPRIANRLLRRVRDFAAVEGDGSINRIIADSALERLMVDQCGLDSLDRKYLSVVIERFDGGPVGVEAIAASLSEERGTLEEVVEPFLLQAGFLTRSPRGRMATRMAYEHLGMPMSGNAPSGAQGRLL
jgi:Holliday junction DNA helicase RuvB